MRILVGMFLLLFVAIEFAHAERTTTDCEICGGTVYQTDKEYVVGNTKYVWIGDPPKKRHCNRCQNDINTGKIDADNPPAFSSRDDEEAGDNPHNNRWAVDKLDLGETKFEKDAHTREAESGFGVGPWVIGLIVGVGLLIRFMLK